MELKWTRRAGNIHRQAAGWGGSGGRAGLGGRIAQVTAERTRGSAAGRQQQDRQAGRVRRQAGRRTAVGLGSVCEAGVPPERPHCRV